MSGALPDPRDRPWLTVAELAEISGEGEKAIRSALDAGHLPVLRVGRYTRIPTAALRTRLGMPQNDSEPELASSGTATNIHVLTKEPDSADDATDPAA